MRGLALVMLVAGIAGVLATPLYPRLCEWADWGLMTAHARRRVEVVRSRLPVMAVGSAGLASVGLLLGLAEVLSP